MVPPSPASCVSHTEDPHQADTTVKNQGHEASLLTTCHHGAVTTDGGQEQKTHQEPILGGHSDRVSVTAARAEACVLLGAAPAALCL